MRIPLLDYEKKFMRHVRGVLINFKKRRRMAGDEAQ